MALIHGSKGLIWFVHQWEPRFSAPALLDDREMLAVVTEINRRSRELAPILNGSDADRAVEVASSDPAVPVRVMAKRHGGDLYVFAVAIRGEATGATFALRETVSRGEAEVLFEDRRLPLQTGRFVDSFAPWDVHCYRFNGPSAQGP